MAVGASLIAAIILVAGGVAAVAASWRLAGRMVGGDLLNRTLAAVVLGLALLCLVVQLMGIAGLLWRWPVTIVLVAICCATVMWVRPVGTEVASRDRWHLDATLACAVGAGLAVLAILLGVQGFSSSPDTVQYHAVNAGTWLHAHSLLTLPPAVPGYPTNGYPANHTLTALWLMLSTGSDQLAYLINLPWALLVVVGMMALVRELGGRPAMGALVAVAVISAPVIYLTQVNSMLSDLAGGGGVVAAAAASLRARRETAGRRGRSSRVLPSAWRPAARSSPSSRASRSECFSSRYRGVSEGLP